MKNKPQIKKTLLEIPIGKSIFITENYYSFLEIKSRLKKQNLGEWKIKKCFNGGFEIYRVK